MKKTRSVIVSNENLRIFLSIVRKFVEVYESEIDMGPVLSTIHLNCTRRVFKIIKSLLNDEEFGFKEASKKYRIYVLESLVLE